MRGSYKRADGRVITPRAWIETDKGVGRFSGTWENPTLGMMVSLDHFRYFDNPRDHTVLFLSLPDCADILNNAFFVTGRLDPSGDRPRRLPMLTLVNGSAS